MRSKYFNDIFQVVSRNLAKNIQNMQKFEYPFVHEKDPKKNKMIPLTLGKRQAEYNRGNCGIFLYWHGRLIEVTLSLSVNNPFSHMIVLSFAHQLIAQSIIN